MFELGVVVCVEVKGSELRSKRVHNIVCTKSVNDQTTYKCHCKREVLVQAWNYYVKYMIDRISSGFAGGVALRKDTQAV